MIFRTLTMVLLLSALGCASSTREAGKLPETSEVPHLSSTHRVEIAAQPSRRTACDPPPARLDLGGVWPSEAINSLLGQIYPGFREVIFVGPGRGPVSPESAWMAEPSKGQFWCGTEDVVWWTEIVTAKGERLFVYINVGSYIDDHTYLVPGEPPKL
jgi:hypothetical protein